MDIDWNYKENSYNKKIYYGNPLWTTISHDGQPKFIDKFTCGFCNLKFISRNQLFNHLGYLNVDIRKKNGGILIDDNLLKRKKRRKRKFYPYIRSCTDLHRQIKNPIIHKKNSQSKFENLFQRLKISNKDFLESISNLHISKN